MTSRKLQTLGVSAALLAASVLSAQAVTVREFAIGGNATVSVSVPGFSAGERGGIISLKAGGAVQQGFCVDPFRGSSSGSAPYSFSALQGGSKFAVGAAHAGSMANKWTLEYTGALTGDTAAAILPVAAGGSIGGAVLQLSSASVHGAHSIHFHTADNPGAGIVLGDFGDLNFHTADNPGAGIVLADFGGGFGGGQNPTAQAVPDAGSTLLLFAVAMGGVMGLRKRFGFGAAAN